MLRYALIATIVLAATPACAQDFLRGLARSAAEAAVRGAVNRALTPSHAAPQAEDGEDGGEQYAEAASTPAPTPAKTVSVRDIPKPADIAEKTKALEAFSRYSCNACEGGRGYDSWARHGLNLVGHNKLEAKMGGLAVGQSVSWKGVVADGQGIVTAEAEQLGFPCKQVTWRMTKGKESMEREGLFCEVLMGNAPGAPTWVEVY